jgi:hypothetical protein
LLGFRASRDTEQAFIDYIQERRVLRYEPDRHTYQYEKELEDFIHSRQVPSANGDGEVDQLTAEHAKGAAAKSPRPRRHQSPPLPR